MNKECYQRAVICFQEAMKLLTPFEEHEGSSEQSYSKFKLLLSCMYSLNLGHSLLCTERKSDAIKSYTKVVAYSKHILWHTRIPLLWSHNVLTEQTTTFHVFSRRVWIVLLQYLYVIILVVLLLIILLRYRMRQVRTYHSLPNCWPLHPPYVNCFWIILQAVPPTPAIFHSTQVFFYSSRQ